MEAPPTITLDVFKFVFSKKSHKELAVWITAKFYEMPYNVWYCARINTSVFSFSNNQFNLIS